MEKTKIDNIIDELKSRELNFTDLDNYMENNGFYSVYADGSINDIKECGNVVYTGVESGECEVLISFDIINENSTDESYNFDILITDVGEFN